MKYVNLDVIKKKIILKGNNLLVNVDFTSTWSESLKGITKTAVRCSYLALDEFDKSTLFNDITTNKDLSKLESSVYSGYWEINYIKDKIKACNQ